ncbi:ATP-binding cassette domain-containing protein [Lentzea tibetensis]|uniref:ATP-binding cassette domain-containing protein n=1 Tax=Lentzea tibetensis TaxID=2591470 RepID=A0A563EQZ0_9PSEU|nr:ATP-binding cassette domain-containing protein [Lentzea tibetensis]TWP49251.1 ATP-binding cassette domain-containing protein [Lentzea tibetensis]
MRVGATRIGLAVVVGALAELSGVALTATATWLIMRAAEQPPMAALTVAIVAVRALAMARGGLRYAERLTGHSAVLRHAVELRGRVYDSLLRRKNIPSGDALTQLVSDVDKKLDVLLRCLIPASVAGLVSLVAIAVATSWPLTIGLLLTGVALPLVSAALARRRLSTCAPLRARLADHAVFLVHGREELVAFDLLDDELAKAGRIAKTLASKERTADLTALAILVQFGTALLMLTQGDPAWLVLGAIAAFEVTLPLTTLAQASPLGDPAVGWGRDELPTPIISAGTDNSGPRVHLAGKINSATAVPLAGRIAIVGPTGAGKTTMLNAIARQLEPCRGALADAHVFNTTVRANVLLAKPDATQEELDRAAEIVELDLDWDTRVGERGEQISGGQRQRLILARTVLADPEVMLLDEPTEGLDPKQADAVLERILANCRGTAVVVTHRMEQLRLFDHVHHRGPVGDEDVRRVGQPLVTDLDELGQRAG